MNLDKSGRIFFGCKIDSKLRDAMHHAQASARRYFEGTEFLQICTVGEGEQWIGKILTGGLNVNEVEDIQRNVVSILRRIASDIRVSPSSVKIFVVAPEDSARSDEAGPDAGAERERGPYIANF
ncbi:hypothetical protein [Haliangium sp.]|uniref:hypothetical protein n=1 Tax=Haliangium sp. TaxID=2663208 RepID=UPI003D10832D